MGFASLCPYYELRDLFDFGAGRSLRGTHRDRKRDTAEYTFAAALVRLMWSRYLAVALVGHAADAIPVLDGEN